MTAPTGVVALSMYVVAEPPSAGRGPNAGAPAPPPAVVFDRRGAAAVLSPAVAALVALTVHLLAPNGQAPSAGWTARLPIWLHPYPVMLEALLVGLPLLAALEGAWRPRPAGGRPERRATAAPPAVGRASMAGAAARLGPRAPAADGFGRGGRVGNAGGPPALGPPQRAAGGRRRPGLLRLGPRHAQAQPDDAAVLPRTRRGAGRAGRGSQAPLGEHLALAVAAPDRLRGRRDGGRRQRRADRLVHAASATGACRSCASSARCRPPP